VVPAEEPGTGSISWRCIIEVTLIRRYAVRLLVAGLALSSPSRGTVPPVLPVVDASDCPSFDQVARELGPLLPGSRIEPGQEGAPEPVAEIVDLGSSYRIRIAGQERDIGDADRNCAERARVAAVVIALVVDPPGVGEPERAATAPPAPVPAPTPPQAPPVRKPAAPSGSLRMEVTARAALTDDHLVAGPGLRAMVGGRSWGAGLGMGLLSPATVPLGSGEVRVLRFPGDISMELRLPSGNLEVAPILGIALDLVHASGQDFERSTGATRLDPGARAAIGLRYFAGTTWGALLEGSVTWLPRTYEVAVEPSGPRTDLPRLWFGASIGAIVNAL
jgi:hypothetical protein